MRNLVARTSPLASRGPAPIPARLPGAARRAIVAAARGGPLIPAGKHYFLGAIDVCTWCDVQRHCCLSAGAALAMEKGNH